MTAHAAHQARLRVKAPARKIADAARTRRASGASNWMVFHSTSTSNLLLVFEMVERRCCGLAGELERGLHAAEKIGRADTDPDDENGEWREGEDLAKREVADFVVGVSMRLSERAEKHALHEPEHVPCAEYYARYGEDGNRCELSSHKRRRISKGKLKNAEVNTKLAGIAVKAGVSNSGY